MKKYSAELISFGLLVCGIGLSWGNVAWFQAEIVRFVWYLVAFIPVGFPVLKEAVECLREKEYFNEFMLMSLAAIGAFYIGEYPEGVAVMLFYFIGEKFQDSAVSRARRISGLCLMYVRSRRRLFVTGKKRSRNRNKFVSGRSSRSRSGNGYPWTGACWVTWRLLTRRL